MAGKRGPKSSEGNGSGGRAVEPPRDPYRLQLYVEGGKKVKKAKKKDNRLDFLGDVGSAQYLEEHNQQTAIDGALMITVPTPDKPRKGNVARKRKEVPIGDLTKGNTIL